MKKSTYLRVLSVGAFFLAGQAFAAATSFVADESTAGMKWTTVEWSNGVPTNNDTATVSIGDSINPLVVDGAQVIGNATLNNSTYLLIDGEGNSITTTLTGSGGYGDVILNGNSILEVKNGASLTLANGMSLKGFGNSKILFDKATFTGMFHDAMHSAVFQNGSQVNLTGVNLTDAFDILVKDSTITSLGDVKFRYGSSEAKPKTITLDNTTWEVNGKGINLSGIVNVINGSDIKNTPHFNFGYEGGATGVNIITVQGTSADNLAELQGSQFWMNSGEGATTSLVLAGYTNAKATGTLQSGANFTSNKEVSIKFEGTNNTFEVSAWQSFGNNRSNGKATSGNWLITTAKDDGMGGEVFAKNTSMKFGWFEMVGSKDTENDSSIQVKVDWAGDSNKFTSNNIVMQHDATAGSTSVKSFIIRDGATVETSGIYLGNDVTESKSGMGGRNEFIVGKGAILNNKGNNFNLRNSYHEDSTVYNYARFENGATVNAGGNINIATDAAASGFSMVELVGNVNLTRGSINIGNAGSTGGEAWLKITDNDNFARSNININANADTEGAKFGMILDNSTMTGGWKMGNGSQSKFLTLQNGSLWDANNGGINISGTVSVLDSSRIQNSEHFNIGAESGAVSGYNKLYMKGTDADHVASVEIKNLWINTNENSESYIYQDGNSSFTFVSGGKIDSGSAFTGGDVYWIFQGDNNSFIGNGSGRWGDNVKNKTESGSWTITTAQGNGNGGETFATNTSFYMSDLTVQASDVDGNDFNAIIDWAGETNKFSVNSLTVVASKGDAPDALSSVTFRDGASAEVRSNLTIGNSGSQSGTAELIVKDGAVLTQKNKLFLLNSTVEGSTAYNHLVVDNASISPSNEMQIGVTTENNQLAVAGESVVEIKNSTFDYNNNIVLAGSSVEGGEAVSKLIFESSNINLGGELIMGHSNNGGGTIRSGSSYLIVKGENSNIVFTNKTLYSGYNATFYGGDRHIEIEGKNNRLQFGKDNVFFMTSAGSVKQYGGSFDIKMIGEGNIFASRNIDIGATNATAGSNTFYSKGDSAVNKNQILMINGDYNLSIRGSSVADSTIVNTFELAGNTIFKRDNNETIAVGVGNHNMAGGTAQFIVSGHNNELKLWTVTIGDNNSTGGKALFKIAGSNNDINMGSYFAFRGNKDTSELAYVADKGGVSALNVSYVDSFTGLLSIDFTGIALDRAGTYEYVLINSNGALNTDKYCVSSEDVTDIVKVITANEGDTWKLENREKQFMFIYTTSVPEPSTCAAILAALALGFVAYRRRK